MISTCWIMFSWPFPRYLNSHVIQGSRTKTAGAMGYFSKTRSSSGTSSGSVASASSKDQDLSHQFLKRPGWDFEKPKIIQNHPKSSSSIPWNATKSQCFWSRSLPCSSPIIARIIASFSPPYCRWWEPQALHHRAHQGLLFAGESSSSQSKWLGYIPFSDKTI